MSQRSKYSHLFIFDWTLRMNTKSILPTILTGQWPICQKVQQVSKSIARRKYIKLLLELDYHELKLNLYSLWLKDTSALRMQAEEMWLFSNIQRSAEVCNTTLFLQKSGCWWKTCHSDKTTLAKGTDLFIVWSQAKEEVTLIRCLVHTVESDAFIWSILTCCHCSLYKHCFQ